MFKDKMISKVSNCIGDEMSTLINHDCQWTSKSCENVFIQKIGNYCNNVAAKCLCLHRLGYMINGHQNVFWLPNSLLVSLIGEIQAPFLKWFFR